MYWVAFTSLSLILILLMRIKVDQWNGVLTPFRFIIVFQLVTIIPYLLFLKFNITELHPDILKSNGVLFNVDQSIINYIIIQIISFISILAGYISINSKCYKSIELKNTLFTINTLMWISLIVAMTSFSIKLYLVGGLSNTIFFELSDRVELQKGTGFIGYFYEVGFYLSCISALSVASYKKNIRTWITFGLILIISILAFSAFGGRKSVIFLSLSLFIYYNFTISTVNKLRLVHILLGVFLLLYASFILFLRDAGGVSNFSHDSTTSDTQNPIVGVLSNLSYVPQYTYIINNYSAENYWYGASIKDLAISFIPSQIVPDKPPVDDGVYIRNNAAGKDYTPSTPFAKMIPTGWPPQTLGIGWVNFGLIGVIILSYLLGVFYKIFANWLINSNYLWVKFIGVYSLLNFHISVLRIVQFITILLVTLIIYYLSIFVKRLMTSHVYNSPN